MSTARNNEDITLLCRIGKQAHLDGDYRGALDHFSRAISIGLATNNTCDPSCVEAYFYRGVTHQKLKINKRALSDFQTAAKYTRSPQIKSRALYNIALAHSNSNNPAATIASINQYIQLNPDSGHVCHAYFVRANALQHLNRLDEALNDYNHAITLNPKIHTFYGNRGLAHQRKGDLAAAIADHTKAIELAPNDSNAYYNRGVAYHAMSRIEDTLQDLTQFILKEITLHEPSKEKELAFDIIIKLPNELAVPLLKSCLIQDTNLGRVFWEQRGLTAPSLDKGLLKKVVDELRDRHAQFVMYESVEALTSGTSPWCSFFPMRRDNTKKPDEYNDVFDHNLFSL